MRIAHGVSFGRDEGDDGTYLRAGLPPDLLRKLRRMQWPIEDEMDLHGVTGDEAAAMLDDFMAEARERGLRCVRVIHGKGLRSPGREPVLKRRIRSLLARRGEVMAYVEPPPAQGGSGAVLVLLDG